MVENCVLQCPALFLCAPASGQGKTTITAAIARYHRNANRRVRVFKTGPDYLDPLILEQASGSPVTQLDLWMVGKEECRQVLYDAAAVADLILVEGVMGMFDGDPSGADMAEHFDMPVAIVIDGSAMAQTFGAVAQGLADYRPGVRIAGAIANNIGSQRHEVLIREAMPAHIPLLGCVHRHPKWALPERHLGLVHPSEVPDIDYRLDRLADIVNEAGLGSLPDPVFFKSGHIPRPPRSLEGIRIGIARDQAFTFVYAANIECLENMGAKCRYFSPMEDSQLPEVDSLWFPGGYPELHLEQLGQNRAMHEQVREFHAAGGKILAECGGMLYLMESLVNLQGQSADLVGILPGAGIMRDRGGCQGMQTARLPEGRIRAHAHHRTRCEGTLEPYSFGERARHPAPGEPLYRLGNLTASYLHFYFPSSPEVVSHLFG